MQTPSKALSHDNETFFLMVANSLTTIILILILIRCCSSHKIINKTLKTSPAKTACHIIDSTWKNNTVLSVWSELLQKHEEYTNICLSQHATVLLGNI